ncbi:M20 family metallopeptidase [Spelaeicoccus albus]|uniref:Glutamate carboxypeptidase n=1 Tax=Spelaeicoccus albus TaxID=1280376 RepID=A0A7Z0D1M3_9MICO|nr:M20 family metallopeptidase [Spelaeicoccus albus]NYI67298.1 glutamate carboxypeptidase [Spelaeicoccus albus]
MTYETDGSLLDKARAALPDMLADLRQLVLCESPTSDFEAGRRSADLVAQVGSEHLGTVPERVENGGRVHLRWRLGTGPRRVVILTHHDTVWPIGSLETHPWVCADGIVRGPGCFDMKTGLVQAFYALGGLMADGAPLDGVTLLVTGDEEIGSPTSRELIEAEAADADAVFVLEASGPGGAIKTQRKGTSNYTVTATGLAAHAGLEPENGVNAGLELAAHMLAIAEFGDADAGTTVTPTMLGGGTTSNTVPDSAWVAVDVRAATIAEQDRVDEQMHGLVAQLPGARVSVDGGPNRPPLEAASSGDLFTRACGLADRIGAGPLSRVAVGGASDGNFTAGMGVPTLDGLGAVGGGAHADDEHVVIDPIPGRTALLAALVADVLDGAGAR